jgi:SNF family Na+-dependent transporter
MEIVFQCETKDIQALASHMLFHTTNGRIRSVSMFIALCVGLSLALWGNTASVLEWLIVLIVIWPFVSYLVGRYMLRVLAQTIRKNGLLVDDHKVLITSEGIRDQTSSNSNFTGWVIVTDVLQNKHYYIVVMGWAQYIVIPKRVFSNPERAQDFFEAMISYWRTATSTVAETK